MEKQIIIMMNRQNSANRFPNSSVQPPRLNPHLNSDLPPVATVLGGTGMQRTSQVRSKSKDRVNPKNVVIHVNPTGQYQQKDMKSETNIAQKATAIGLRQKGSTGYLPKPGSSQASQPPTQPSTAGTLPSHPSAITTNINLYSSQKPIFRLLTNFKLQQYSQRLEDLGFGDNIFQLTMLGSKKKQEIYTALELMPGHRTKFEDLFTKIETMYPKSNVLKTLDSANKQQALLVQIQQQTSNEMMSVGAPKQPVINQVSVSAKSPTGQQQNQLRYQSLTRRFAQLDPATQKAINESFLQNVKQHSTSQGKIQNVSDALRDFLNKGDTAEQKYNYISSIFKTKPGTQGIVQKSQEQGQTAGGQGGFFGAPNKTGYTQATTAQAQQSRKEYSMRNETKQTQSAQKVSSQTRMQGKSAASSITEPQHNRRSLGQVAQSTSSTLMRSSSRGGPPRQQVPTFINPPTSAVKPLQTDPQQKTLTSFHARIKSATKATSAARAHSDSKRAKPTVGQDYQSTTIGATKKPGNLPSLAKINPNAISPKGIQQSQYSQQPHVRQNSNQATSTANYSTDTQTYAQLSAAKPVKSAQQAGRNSMHAFQNNTTTSANSDMNPFQAAHQPLKHAQTIVQPEVSAENGDSFRSKNNNSQSSAKDNQSSATRNNKKSVKKLPPLSSQQQPSQASTEKRTINMMARPPRSPPVQHVPTQQPAQLVNPEEVVITQSPSNIPRSPVATEEIKMPTSSGQKESLLQIESSNQAPQISTDQTNNSVIDIADHALPFEPVLQELDWSPLISNSDKQEAAQHGYSFGSKKVGMSAALVNLRFMCHCLARAIKMHLDFNPEDHYFLHDRENEQNEDNLRFTYNFNKDLKLTLNPKMQPASSQATLPQSSDAAVTDQMVEQKQIDIDKEVIKIQSKLNSQFNLQFDRNLVKGFKGKEPEPEMMSLNDSDDEAQFERDTKALPELKKNDKSDSVISQGDFAEQTPIEQKSNERGPLVNQVRSEILPSKNSILLKDSKRINEMSQESKGQIGQVILQELEPAQSDTLEKTKAEYLMAQVDLEPIESYGSQELSLRHKTGQTGSQPPTSQPFQVAQKPQTPLLLPIAPQKAQQQYIDIETQQMRDFVMEQLNRFDCRTEYDAEFLNTEYSVRRPTEFDIVDYCKYVTIACKMEHEIPIIALVYIERLLLKTGILLNRYNWQRVLLVCLCLASKVWDDDSLENQHFPKVMPNVTLLEINRLEQAYLDFVDYQLVISGAQYAKYYFIMRTLADSIILDSGKNLSDFENEKRNKKSKKEEWGQFPLKDVITADRMLDFQKNIARAEQYLKERHERSFIDAFRDSQLQKYKKVKQSLDQTI